MHSVTYILSAFISYSVDHEKRGGCFNLQNPVLSISPLSQNRDCVAERSCVLIVPPSNQWTLGPFEGCVFGQIRGQHND